MDILRLVAFAAGLFIVFATLRSALRTFVLPRSAPEKITRTVFVTMRRLFNVRVRKADTYEERDALMANYAPITLIILLATWVLIVMIGYMFMFWAIGVEPLEKAFITSSSSVLTLGVAPVSGLGQMALALSASFIGLLLVALLIAYLPTLYSAFSKREAAVTMLEVRAGSPPSAIEMFTRFHRLKRMEKLAEVWLNWEIWFVELEETHTSLAALSFFRSPQGDRSWITATGAVLDAAALYVSTLDLEHDPQADLCIRAGYIALRRIADFFGIPYNDVPLPTDPISITQQEFDDAYDELVRQGVPVKPDREKAWRDFSGWRVNYDTVLIALAALTMAPYAPWSSDRSLSRDRASVMAAQPRISDMLGLRKGLRIRLPRERLRRPTWLGRLR
jgi:hypothetical protein